MASITTGAQRLFDQYLASATPTITIQPSSQSVPVGASVTFSAAASGAPTPTYQWEKDGVNIAGATNATYTIASSSLADSGTYLVIAANSAGSVSSAGALLTIIEPPSNAVVSITVQ